MSLFSFNFGKNQERADNADNANPTGRKRVLLHIDPIGWKSLFLDADGTPLREPRSSENLDPRSTGLERLEQLLKDAVAAHSKEFAKTEQICLLLEGNSVQYTDNKPIMLLGASGATVRLFGERMTNTNDVTFAQYCFPELPGRKRKDPFTLYAFANAAKIRNSLALFDKHGVKISEVIPKGYLLLARGLKTPDKAYGSIQMSATETTVALIHPLLGAILVRTIPVGVLTLIMAVSEKLGMKADDALKALASKDWVSEISPETNNQENDSNQLQQAPLVQALQPHLHTLLKGLNETLEFFAIQRVAGRPEYLETFGVNRQIKGLADWISQHANIPLKNPNITLLELFAQEERPVICNLLQGSESSLLTVGRTQYYYTQENGFVTSRGLDQKKSLMPSADEQLGRGRDASGKRTRKNSTSKRSKLKRKGRNPNANPSLIQTLTALFQQNENQPGIQEETSKDKAFFALFGFMLFALLYWGYSEYEIISKKYQRYSQTYVTAREKNDQLNKQTQDSSVAFSRVAHTQNITKILWTEKFLALAKHLDNHIWLSDLYLSRATRDVQGATVESTKLVFEGHVLPSTDGHIKKMSEYLHRLLTDEEGFMSDFRNITFNGLELSEAQNDPVVNFTLDAWYDQNKRLELKAPEEKKKPAGMLEMNQNIQHHNKELEKLVPSSKKGR